MYTKRDKMVACTVYIGSTVFFASLRFPFLFFFFIEYASIMHRFVASPLLYMGGRANPPSLIGWNHYLSMIFGLETASFVAASCDAVLCCA